MELLLFQKDQCKFKNKVHSTLAQMAFTAVVKEWETICAYGCSNSRKWQQFYQIYSAEKWIDLSVECKIVLLDYIWLLDQLWVQQVISFPTVLDSRVKASEQSNVMWRTKTVLHIQSETYFCFS